MLWVFLLYVFFASAFTISKTALQYSQPFFLIGSRMLIAGCLMLIYEKFFNKGRWEICRSEIIGILQLGFFSIYLTNICESWALQYLTTFKTCFIYSLSPFFSALLCYLIFQEKLTKAKWLGLVIGFGGFFPTLVNQSVGEQLSGQLLFFSWAELVVIVATVSSVYGWILLGSLVKNKERSPVVINGLSMVIGGIFALIHSLIFEDWSPIPVIDFISFLKCSVLLMIISNLVAYNLYGLLLKKYSPTFLSFAGFSTPIFTAIFGWYYLNETISFLFFTSIVVVFVGLFLFHQEELMDTSREKINAND